MRLNELAIALRITTFTTVVYARMRPEPDGGAVLTWCESGTDLRVVDCAARGQTCAWQSDAIGYNCL